MSDKEKETKTETVIKTDQTEAAEEPEAEEERITVSGLLFDWIGTLLSAMLIVLLIMTFFFRQVNVDGDSMKNTLHDKDRLIVASFMYTPQNGDIVIITHGEKYQTPVVKRVIATPGQKLRIDYENNKVYVDGVELHEEYIRKRISPVTGEEVYCRTIELPDPTEIPDVIPEGYVFVMGDNREESLDSRSKRIGLIPVDNIIGKAIFRFWPFDSFGTV